MAIIDADCHVIETEDTWAGFDESQAEHRPLVLTAAGAEGEGKRLLAIDGRLWNAAPGDASNRKAVSKRAIRESLSGYVATSDAVRTMRDVPGRLRHMDELGVDVQVLYPTIFLSRLTARPPLEVALCRSYNRWLGSICKESRGRLRWVAVPPLLNMEAALDELAWARDSGACGIFMRGFEGERLLSHPFFFPLYERAQELDLPICVHAGGANPAYAALVEGSAFSTAKVLVFSAFHHLLYYGIPARFPRLRFGFIEATASWLPYVLTDLRRRLARDGLPPLGKDPLRDNRLYVACQTNDDLRYILGYGGEDNLVIGSDYGHSDTSSELEALRNLRATELPASIVRKILEDNPARLYGL